MYNIVLYFTTDHATITTIENILHAVLKLLYMFCCNRNFSWDGHHAHARVVCVVRLVSMADSSTERLHKLLTASTSRCCITRTYLIKPSLISVGFPKK